MKIDCLIAKDKMKNRIDKIQCTAASDQVLNCQPKIVILNNICHSVTTTSMLILCFNKFYFLGSDIQHQ